MKHLFFALLLTCCTAGLTAQQTELVTPDNKLLIKLAPAKLFYQSVGAGLEYALHSKMSLEMESSLKNIVNSTPLIRERYIADNNTIYYDISTRMKLFATPEFMKTSGKYFNGFYIAPGLIGGIDQSRWTYGTERYMRSTIDIGLMIANNDRIIVEVFGGYHTTLSLNQDALISSIKRRAGLRIGVTL